MFGYIMPDREEMKGKHMDRYRMFYCGVCRDIKASAGESARLTLTYDMTFLAILLTALFEGKIGIEEVSCLLHPGKKQKVIRNEYTAYAADMNLLLVYHNLMDDWVDDRNLKSYTLAKAIRKAYLKKVAEYPRQVKAIRRYLKKLHRIEEQKQQGIELAAGLTGQLMAEIYDPTPNRKKAGTDFAPVIDEIWVEDLRRLGFYIGKFIYLIDAWEDLDKDRESGSYNPLLSIADEADYEEKAARILTLQAADAAKAFERLPLVTETEILRNVLYSGMWVKYRTVRDKRLQKTDEKADGNCIHKSCRCIPARQAQI